MYFYHIFSYDLHCMFQDSIHGLFDTFAYSENVF